ncbi:MAG: hypothetical protein M3Q81_01640 [bacterium]|nr:hypothetical protein [bacterium]
MKKLPSLTTISTLVFALCSVALIVWLFLLMPSIQTYLKNQAIQDCATSYRLEFTEAVASSSTKVVRPLDELYENCLAEKGL